MIAFVCAMLIAIPLGCLVYWITEEMEKERLRFQYFSHQKIESEESLLLTLNRPLILKLSKQLKITEIYGLGFGTILFSGKMIG